METDFSTGAVQMEAPGSTSRGWWTLGFNDENIAAEDWTRNEVAKNNDLIRQMQILSREQEFNSSEAQKNRDWQAEMSNTAYQRAVEDMKAAGINPLLAVSNGSASTPSGSSASSSGSYSSSGSAGARSSGTDLSGLSGLLVGIGKIAAGLYSGNSGSVVSGFSDVVKSTSSGTVKTRTYSFK